MWMERVLRCQDFLVVCFCLIWVFFLLCFVVFSPGNIIYMVLLVQCTSQAHKSFSWLLLRTALALPGQCCPKQFYLHWCFCAPEPWKHRVLILVSLNYLPGLKLIQDALFLQLGQDEVFLGRIFCGFWGFVIAIFSISYVALRCSYTQSCC